ncbi:MAG TPA: hypothetical protein PK765_04515 [bacterium]|nr:hypothetical protein [bacterium]
MRSKFVRVVVAAGLSVMLAVPMPSLAASDISTSVSDVSVVPVTRDVKIVEKLLAIKPRLLEVVAEGYDSQFAIFDDAGTPAADYFYDQRDAYVEALSAVYDSMEYDDFAMHPDYGDTLSYE